MSSLLFHAYVFNYNWNCSGLDLLYFKKFNLKAFIFRKLLELFERNIFISWTYISVMIHVFSSKFVIIMSGRFTSIFLSALIVKSHRTVTSVLSITGCGIHSYHLSVWAKVRFLHNIQCIKLATQSRLWRYSVLKIVEHADSIWSTVLSLSPSLCIASNYISTTVKEYWLVRSCRCTLVLWYEYKTFSFSF